MIETLFAALATVLVPWLVGVLTKWLTNLAKSMDTFAASGNTVKRIVVVFISTLLTTLLAWAGVHVTGSPFQIGTQEMTTVATALITGLSSLVSAVYAMTAHNGDKVSHIGIPSKPTDGTPSIPVTRPTI